MNILLLGDSHTDIFEGPHCKKFDLKGCDPELFTQKRFADSDDLNLWNKLDLWFEENTTADTYLVITSGDIDVRAHFWRHIPRNYQNSIDLLSYIKDKSLKFYQSLIRIYEKYQLKQIVVWGTPVAGEKAQYNFQAPFVGSSQTRNKLIHLWNKEFINLIINDSRINFATAYYNFINPLTYSTIDPNPSHDGVHWHHSFGNLFWNQLIIPALNGNKLLISDNWNLMCNDQFIISEDNSTGTQLYDTWACTNQIKDLKSINKNVIINNVSYSYIRAENRDLLPETYRELCLQKIT